MTDRDPGVLLDILEEARELGLLGPGPVARQYEHALDLARGIGEFDGRVLDLGSGGGLPGLVLFDVWPEATGVLLDAQRRRCDFLAGAVSTLDLGARVAVECGRAEALARDERLRGSFDLVVARSFGPPAVTAECSVGFLRSAGSLVVTEPPDDGRGVDAVGSVRAHGARVRHAAPDPGRRDGCRADPVGRGGGRSLAAPRRRAQQTTSLVTTGQSALVSGQPPTRKKSRPVIPGTPTTPGSGPTFQRRCPVAALTAR